MLPDAVAQASRSSARGARRSGVTRFAPRVSVHISRHDKVAPGAERIDRLARYRELGRGAGRSNSCRPRRATTTRSRPTQTTWSRPDATETCRHGPSSRHRRDSKLPQPERPRSKGGLARDPAPPRRARLDPTELTEEEIATMSIRKTAAIHGDRSRGIRRLHQRRCVHRPRRQRRGAQRRAKRRGQRRGEPGGRRLQGRHVLVHLPGGALQEPRRARSEGRHREGRRRRTARPTARTPPRPRPRTSRR